ncbi:ArgE/DapE family deacylase [Aureimonas ureilytica]|uniref:ArgE/DapE family deacylase n=1 Tax=Aureimonas ureilytica TaxID=401562 RepID=UPI00058C3EDE|nr:ArgE/DapE family deacylase [Aureimonas ureilytica]
MGPHERPSSLSPELVRRICAAVDERFDEQVAFLSDLVRHVSLRGREEAVQDMVEGSLRARGYDIDRFPVDGALVGIHPAFSWAAEEHLRGTNIVATMKGRGGGGRSLALNAHVDVVPAGVEDRWSSPPFEPVVRDGWMHGRGSADMKAGLSANVFALDALQAAGVSLRGDVQVHSVVEEETTGNGAASVLARGYRADAFLCPEPTDERLVRANSGIAKFALEVSGIPTHPQEPGKGRSAIDLAVRLMARLRELEARWIAERLDKPHFAAIPNPVSLTFGTISGGEWQASVASACRIKGRIGFYPGDDPRRRTREFEDCVASTTGDDPAFAGAPSPTVHWNGSVHAGYELEPGTAAEAVLSSAHAAAREGADGLRSSPMPCYLDAAVFAVHGGMTTLVYGPVGERIHGIDERVDLASLRRVTKTIALFAAGWCGIDV